MNLEKKNLFKNTLFLYVLTFLTYFLGFISIPFQTRVLGPELFGKLSFAISIMIYFKLLVDFGFILSATEEITNNRDNKKELSKIVTSVTLIKLFLSAISFIIVVALILSLDRLREDLLLYIFSLTASLSASFLPDYLYRGLENMKVITIRTVLIQVTFVIMLFMFLRNEEDYYLVPLLTTLGNLVAVLASYVHIKKFYGLKFILPSKNYLLSIFKKSSNYFYSRIATTIYTSSNVVVLGITYPSSNNIVGIYSATDKLIGSAKSLFSPVADSLYPYMIRKKDYRLIKIVLLILLPIVLVCSILVAYFAEPICTFILGEQFREAAYILKILIPIVIITPLVYLLGFPVLTPMGLSKHANLSILIAVIFHILGLAVLYYTNYINIYSLCYLTVVTEFIVLIYRILVIFIIKRK